MTAVADAASGDRLRRGANHLLRNRSRWLAAAIAIRLVFVALPWGYGFDLRTFREWALALNAHPWGSLYAALPTVDHLPGDLLLHGWLARLAAVVLGPELPAHPYTAMLKLVPALADIALAFVLAALVRPWQGPRRADLVALTYLLSPATVIAGVWWGQWDVVSALLLAVACLVLIRWRHGWVVGAPLLTWSALIKPQLTLAVAVGGVVWLLAGGHRHARRLGWGRPSVLAAPLLALVTAEVIGRPFSVSLLGTGTHWTWAERAAFASDRFTAVTMGSPNLWSLVFGPGAPPPDSTVVLGLTARSWGHLLLGLAVIFSVAVALAGHRRGWPLQNAVTAAALGSLASFALLTTRSHERYLFPAFVLGIVWAALAETPAERTRRTTAHLLTQATFALTVLAVLVISGAAHQGWWLALALAQMLLAYPLTMASLRPLAGGRHTTVSS